MAVEAALGLRSKLDIYGSDYPTPDGTCIRDYIHVSDLVRAHSDALRYLRAGGDSVTLNCGYGHGFSVREVVEMVKRVSGVDFKVEIAPRRLGDPARIVAASDLARATFGWKPHYDDLATIIAPRLPGRAEHGAKGAHENDPALDARLTNRAARGARGSKQARRY